MSSAPLQGCEINLRQIEFPDGLPRQVALSPP